MSDEAAAIVNLAGKVVLVTGGGSGLGADMAALFDRLGAYVLLADINASRVKAAAEQIGGRTLGIPCDIADEGDVARLGKLAESQFGRVDALINNAAHVDTGADLDLLSTDLAVWDRTMSINLRGTMLVSRAILPLIIGNGGGSVVTIVSRQGIAPPRSGNRLCYGTSKAGLIMFARHLAVAYGKQGIRSNAVAPGTIESERMLATLSEERLAQSRSNVLTPYLGAPSDVSNCVAYLISDAGRYITGQTIQVDGGVLTGLHE